MMSEQAKKGCVPVLRFPEFREIWTTKKLGELGKLIGGGTPNKSVSEYWQGEIPWISSSDIFEDDIHNISITRYINEKSISESATKIVPEGSVLFVSRVGTGKLAINNKEVCTSQDFTNFIPEKIHNYFLGYFFVANKSILTSLDQGTSIKGFSKADLEKFELSFPSESEQQKIAACLSSLDELITAQAQKVEALKTHKKGLMQQLFPAEGESVPKLRFPEFREAGEWKNELLDNLAIRGSGHTPNKKYSNYYNGGIKWVSLADSKRLDKGEIFETEIEISEEGLKNSSAVLHPKGSVLLSRDAGVGKSAVMASPMAVSQHFIVWIPKDGVLLNWFLYYILQIGVN